jgi:integrase
MLRWKDDGSPRCNYVCRDTNRLVFEKHKTRRWTGAAKDTKLSPEVEAILADMRVECVGSPWLFPGMYVSRNRRITYKLDRHVHVNSIRDVWTKVLERAGLKYFRFYDLRGIAEGFAEKRLGAVAAASMMGHSVEVARRHYLAEDDEQRHVDEARFHAEYVVALRNGGPTKTMT